MYLAYSAKLQFIVLGGHGAKQMKQLVTLHLRLRTKE